jgi:hypothetical protein
LRVERGAYAVAMEAAISPAYRMVFYPGTIRRIALRERWDLVDDLPERRL